jgi:hypothetical protein
LVQPYEYQHLSDGYIRLLLLHPRYSDGRVVCSLIETRLDQAPLIEAVSYAWDSPKRDHTITIDGKRLNIPSNAFHLLRDSRSFILPRLIWIDSVCIYSDRTVMQSLRSLGFAPPLFEEFNFTTWQSNIMHSWTEHLKGGLDYVVILTLSSLLFSSVC